MNPYQPLCSLFICLAVLLALSACGKRNDIITIHVLATDLSGLSTKAPVEISGIPVGEVMEIGLTPRNEVLVTLSIDTAVRVSHSARAALRRDGMLGDSHIVLIDTLVEPPFLVDGDTLNVKLANGSLLQEIMNDKDNGALLDSTTAAQLDSMLTEEVVPNLRQLIQKFTEEGRIGVD